MKQLWITLFLVFITFITNAQDYEIWGTFKVSGQINKWIVEVESEDRYSFDTDNIRYFHYDIGALYRINNSFKIGFFYRDISESKNGVINRITVPHGDIIFSYYGFNFRTRLEYIVKIGDYENKFRLRIRPSYQMSIWKNFNPFIQDEIFLTDIDELARNRLNFGVSIKMGKFVFQPGYLLESNYKNLWSNRNVLWFNTKIKF